MPRLVAKHWCIVVVAFAALLMPLVALAEAGDSVYLPILTNSLDPDAGAPTSEDLIDEAESGGAISHETALAYKVYATFGDSRLPAQYQGAPALDSDAATQALSEYASLTEGAKATLAPFLIPPYAPGSWYGLPTVSAQDYDPTDRMRYYDAVAGVRVWYDVLLREDGVKAHDLAAAIDVTIVPALDAAMGRRWLSDAALQPNGGDGRLDIMIVGSLGHQGLTVGRLGCGQTPVVVYLRDDLGLGSETSYGMMQVAAHEMMHAVQFATPVRDACSLYAWMREAIATWFMDHAYPEAQVEQQHAPAYLSTTDTPIEADSGTRNYGAYLYFQYLARQQDGVSAVRATWAGTRTQSSLGALTKSGAGVYWPGFARAAWNQWTITTFRDWDGLTAGVTNLEADERIGGVSGTRVYRMPTVLEHLSAQYYRFRFTDDTARTAIFYNGLTYDLREGTPPGYENEVFYYTEPVDDESQKDSITVQALYKVEGDDQWKIEDWTQWPEAGFCRDTKDGRIQELVLIFANSEYEDTNPDYTFSPKGKPPTLLVSDIGCYRWEGTVTATYVGTGDKVDVRTASNVVFERVGGYGRLVGERQQYLLTGGSLTRSYVLHTARGTSYDCVWTLPGGSISLGTSSTFGLLETLNGLTGGAHFYSYTGSADSEDEQTFTITGDHCGSPGDPPQTTTVGEWFHTDANTSDATLPKFTSGSVMDASYTDDAGEWQYTWHLEAKREGE